MTLPDEVMNDLMAVYLAGEISPATRRLVEDYAREHPDYAAALRRAAELEVPGLSVSPAPDLEIATLKRTRQFVLMRSIFMGSGLFFTLTPFLFHIGPHGWHWLLLGREPGLVWSSASLAAASWVAHWLMNREVRKAGL